MSTVRLMEDKGEMAQLVTSKAKLDSLAGVRWPPMLGAQQEMSSGGGPPTAATESGKLLSPQQEGKHCMAALWYTKMTQLLICNHVQRVQSQEQAPGSVKAPFKAAVQA
ncbi:hypothetical protein Q8A73_012968 [Channa argus]|nr:hypothetical protein Q8A73_012968 [Channa argus]